jgi:hypothetical protein
MPSRLLSTTTKNYYLITVDDVVYSYSEEIGDGDNLLDYQITLSSIIDGTMAAREVTDHAIRNKVLAVISELEKQK